MPDEVLAATHEHSLTFGPDYLIPKPLDPRVVPAVAPAVAEAAIRSGVARRKDFSLATYGDELITRLSHLRMVSPAMVGTP